MNKQAHLFLRALEVFLLFLLISLFAHPIRVAEPQSISGIDVTIAIREGGRYQVPSDGKVHIVQRPTPFRIILTNVSKSSQAIYEQRADEYLAVSLEIIGPDGRKRQITRKKQATHTRAVTSTYLKSGESKIIPMLIQSHEWNEPTGLGQEKGQIYKIRAVFNNQKRTLHSPYYEVTFE